MNHLLKERSPYLLQHVDNPVDWYPWGKEALEKSVRENKPIFLSIGYSTCHWCHVMAHESFESQEIADILNKNFVSIKVDREERPDLDSIYMKAVMALTGSGGWPMSLFLTPKLLPIFGGTYFPPEDKWGKPGFKNILMHINESWIEKKDEIILASENLKTHLSKNMFNDGSDNKFTPQLLEKAIEQFKSTYDSIDGGFHAAPKFPSPHQYLFLLTQYDIDLDPKIIEMVTHSLKKMALGGIYDHLGGGFARYSTDNRWFAPHFEKMLYDNALLSKAFLETYLVTKDSFYRQVAENVFQYIQREMTSSEGLFYSAEDADSEGEEGLFYVWTYDELKNILSEEDLKLAKAYFHFTEEGNWENGKNILYLTESLREFVSQNDLDLGETKEKMLSIQQKLFTVRETKVRPGKDEKIITSWNGLMIASMAYAGRVLNNEDYLKRAVTAALSIKKYLTKENQLYRILKDGQFSHHAFLDDYSFLIAGYLEIYQSTFDPIWLKETVQLTKQTIHQFWNRTENHFNFSGKLNEELPFKNVDFYDGALPSENFVMATNLIKLGHLTSNQEYLDYAEKIIQCTMTQLESSPMGYSQMLTAASLQLNQPKQLILVGDKKNLELNQVIYYLRTQFNPNLTIQVKTYENEAELNELVPFIKNYPLEKEKVTIYLCENFNCQLPVHNLSDLKKLLE